MVIKEKIIISDCCNYKTTTKSAVLGTPEHKICNRCLKECDVHYVEVQTYIQIGQGHYRPTFNKRKYGFKR